MENVFPPIEFDKSALFIQEGMEEGRKVGLHLGALSVAWPLLEHRLGTFDEMAPEMINALPN